GDFEVDRDYRIKTDSRCKASIYMQGFCEASHGLSDTLLSVLPIRADEIAESLYANVVRAGGDQSVLERLVAVG
ncbi:MAG: ornithine monooxygenase, partial [Pseudomonas caspiana]